MDAVSGTAVGRLCRQGRPWTGPCLWIMVMGRMLGGCKPKEQSRRSRGRAPGRWQAGHGEIPAEAHGLPNRERAFQGKKGIANSYRSSGYVDPHNLYQSNNVLLYGDLEGGA